MKIEVIYLNYRLIDIEIWKIIPLPFQNHIKRVKRNKSLSHQTILVKSIFSLPKINILQVLPKNLIIRPRILHPLEILEIGRIRPQSARRRLLLLMRKKAKKST